MKYFAKYLPVEGEIKEGEKNFLRKGIFSGFTGGIPLELVSSFKEEGYEIAKLFLCSKDIQVGDDVYEKGLEFEGVIKVVKSIYTPPKQGDYKQHPISWIILDKAIREGAYKVIGEISPKAVWVKEGDEFSKEDIELSLIDDNGYWLRGFSLENSPSNQWYNPPSYCRAYVKIKCPTCKTFH